MSNAISEPVISTKFNDETLSFNELEQTDVNSAGSTQGITIPSEEVSQQIRVVTDPLARQLELLCFSAI